MKSILNRRNFFAVLVALIVMCITAGVANCGTYSGGTGEPNNPYLISTAEDMNAIGADSNDWDKHFILTNDIDLSYYDGQDGRPQFNIIADFPNNFVGVFDGNNHVIRNFTVSLTGLQRGIALFRNTSSGAVIKNLDMENSYVNVPEGNRIASIHGEGTADIINCKVSGTIIGSYYVGGLSGQNYGKTESCYSYCAIVGGGGGGLVGRNSGIVNQCYSRSIVSGSDDVGGLVGRNYGLITNSYSDSSVTSDSYGAGGLVGENTDTILGCYALGSANGDFFIGGLIGEGGGDLIENCYTIVDVNGNSYVGGLIGFYDSGTISKCYSSGSVTGDEYVGGLVGYDSSNVYTSCFWDSNVNPDVNGIGNTTDPNVIGETTANMQTESTFTSAGWDFNTPIWKFCSLPDYPSLWWEECPVLEPAELIAELLGEIGELALPGGIENSLMAKLEAALGALQDENENNDAAAVNSLEAFINAVEAQRGKKIPEADADALIAAALDIIDLLSAE